MPHKSTFACVLALGLVLAPWAGTAVAHEADPVTDPARIAAAKELLALTGQEAQFEIALTTIARAMSESFKQQQPGHAQAIDEVTALMLAKFSSHKSEILDMVALLFAERFTAAEMGEIAAFHRSAIGQKLIANQPDLMQKSMTLGMQWGQRVAQELEADFRRELKNRDIPL